MGEETGIGRGLIYEVPDDLKYEERIFWAFTLKQLGIFIGFALLAALIFTRADADIRLRLGAAGMLAATGFVFATFAPLQDEVEKRVKFLWAPKHGTWTQPETLTRFIRVKSVAGNNVILQDNRLLSILLVTPVDFSMLSDEQKMVLLAGYRSFLNSLSFPIQILARTTTLNLREYFSSAKARAAQAGNRNALAEIESFEEYVEDYVGRKSVHDRLFYIVIPQETNGNEADARKQLVMKTDNCKEKLANAGIVCRTLGESQLVSLYASFFGGHVEADADYLSLLALLDLATEEREQFKAAQEKFKPQTEEEHVHHPRTTRAKKKS